MIVYRIAGSRHSKDITGYGASIFPGRWNRKGTPVLYTGEHESIALIENLVHLPLSLIPKLVVLTIEIPDDISYIDVKALPKNWKNYPAPSTLASIGEMWVKRGASMTLKVPSVILPSASVYVLNCNHKNYDQVKIVDLSPFEMDERLMRFFKP